MCIYLYVKTHRITGLKYLGKTTNKNPYTYHGSGVDWTAHLKEYGYEYDTEIIKECQSNQELNEWGRYYSDLWNVAKSTDWANRIPETGGGATPSEETKERIRRQLLGKKKPPRSKAHTEKIAETMRGKPNPKVAAKLKKWYDDNPDRSDINQKRSNSIKQWYLKNPNMSHEKALKTWEGRYRKDYFKYESIITLIAQNKTNREIKEIISVDYATIKKLRNKSHPVFELFPEFIQSIGT